MKNSRLEGYILNTKNNGQVFTPTYIVDMMLEECGLVGEKLFKYKIIEPSFGSGVFLLRIIEKMIEYAKENEMPYDELWHSIHFGLYGIEKDVGLYQTVLEKAYSLIAGYAGENDEIWDLDLSENFICGNTLEINQFDGKMDFVIGNPPWIRFHNIKEEKERNLIKSYSFSANGNTDIYITFFEKGLQMLKSDGKLCFITPNSYFNSKMGFEMRKYIAENKMLKEIIDFGHKQIFEGFTTYSCITLLTKQPSKDTLFIKNNIKKRLTVDDYYINKNFYFNANGNFRNIINYSGEQYVKVKNGCATLMDNFFIGNNVFKDSKYSKTAIKSSTGKETFCFFPYDDNGVIIPFEDIEFAEIDIAKYLLENKEKLLDRDIDKNAVWYGFGRSQAISDVHKNKHILNTIYSRKEDVQLIKCKSDMIVYGGIYILGNVKEEILKEILCSDEYFQYVKTIGKYKSGGYYTLGSKEVENFINFSLLKYFKNNTK